MPWRLPLLAVSSAEAVSLQCAGSLRRCLPNITGFTGLKLPQTHPKFEHRFKCAYVVYIYIYYLLVYLPIYSKSPKTPPSRTGGLPEAGLPEEFFQQYETWHAAYLRDFWPKASELSITQLTFTHDKTLRLKVQGYDTVWLIREKNPPMTSSSSGLQASVDNHFGVIIVALQVDSVRCVFLMPLNYLRTAWPDPVNSCCMAAKAWDSWRPKQFPALLI